MAITYKDISQLTQKSAVAGTEKLPVSDTEYITPAQIGSGYLPLAGGSMTGSITLANKTYILSKNTGGTGQNVLGMNENNQVLVGYGSAGNGYDTRMYGNSIQLRYGTSRTEGFTLDSNGHCTAAGHVAVGTGGSNGSYIGSDTTTNIYLHNSSGYILVGEGKVIRRGSSLSDVTLGNATYPWGGVYSSQFVVPNGTSSQYLRADGSVGAITISSSDPTSSQGSNGDIWIKI